MTGGICVMVHRADPDRPRQAFKGLLCQGHVTGLEQHLAELPILAVEVERDFVRFGNGLTPKVSGSPEKPLPFNPTLSAALDSIAVVFSWALLVRDEHPSGLHLPSNTLSAVCAFLTRHLDWICEQPWVDDLAGELRGSSEALSASLTFARTKRVPLGTCAAFLACDVLTHDLVNPCPGMLRALISTNDDELPQVITCSECGASFEPHQWRALSRRLRGDREPMLTIAQLSMTMRVPIPTLYRWATADEWRSTQDRPRRFHQDDANSSFDHHQGEIAS